MRNSIKARKKAESRHPKL